MLFELPDNEVLFQALISRDPSFDGRAYVGVRSPVCFAASPALPVNPSMRTAVSLKPLPNVLRPDFARASVAIQWAHPLTMMRW